MKPRDEKLPAGANDNAKRFERRYPWLPNCGAYVVGGERYPFSLLLKGRGGFAIGALSTAAE
jgi:hypothetical protein